MGNTRKKKAKLWDEAIRTGAVGKTLTACRPRHGVGSKKGRKEKS